MEIRTGSQLEHAVADLGRAMGLEVRTQVRIGRQVWGRQRHIDVVLRSPELRTRLGIECKYQGVWGTAEEKLPATIEDMESWPFRGLVVFHGSGFAESFPAYIRGKGRAIEFDELADWLVEFFDLPDDSATQAKLALNGGAQSD